MVNIFNLAKKIAKSSINLCKLHSFEEKQLVNSNRFLIIIQHANIPLSPRVTCELHNIGSIHKTN